MTFDSFYRVKAVASYYKVRMPIDGESLEDYRKHVAVETEQHNRVQAIELWTGKGWDQFNDKDKMLMVLGLPAQRGEGERYL